MISETEAVLHAQLTAAEAERDQLAGRVRALEEALDGLVDRVQWDIIDKGNEPKSATWQGALNAARAALHPDQSHVTAP